LHSPYDGLPTLILVLLRAEARFDGGAPSLVPFDDPGDQRGLAFGFERQGLFQQLQDVAGRHQFGPRVTSRAPFDDEQHRQHDERDMMMPGTPAQIRAIVQRYPALGREVYALRSDSDLARLAATRAGFGIGICQASGTATIRTSARCRAAFDGLVADLSLPRVARADRSLSLHCDRAPRR